MAKIDWELQDKVALVTMDEADNRLNPGMVNSLLETLDAIEKETEALTVVVNSGHSHIWTNGFDIDWILASLEKGARAEVRQFLIMDLHLRRRLLTYPLITIAALNGHTFGGGAVFSSCFDFRFMRSGRGFFCIPVIDLKYPILPGTRALLLNAYPVHVVKELILAGRRMTATECVSSHVVSAAFGNEELMDKVMAFAGGMNKSRGIVGEMKRVLNGPVIELIDKDAASIKEGEIVV
ncbi:MAG: enoyl-CoA hydratase/isomerase family protein [Dehalococcoidia bacterium]|nr:enoyl-CoA hydratase/isomerase family protein [Dehalococcoidia bacterium]